MKIKMFNPEQVKKIKTFVSRKLKIRKKDSGRQLDWGDPVRFRWHDTESAIESCDIPENEIEEITKNIPKEDYYGFAVDENYITNYEDHLELINYETNKTVTFYSLEDVLSYLTI